MSVSIVSFRYSACPATPLLSQKSMRSAKSILLQKYAKTLKSSYTYKHELFTCTWETYLQNSLNILKPT